MLAMLAGSVPGTGPTRSDASNRAAPWLLREPCRERADLLLGSRVRGNDGASAGMTGCAGMTGASAGMTAGAGVPAGGGNDGGCGSAGGCVEERRSAVRCD